MKCPTCGLINPPDAQRCDCGYDFEAQTMERSYLSSQDRGAVPREVKQFLIALVTFNVIVSIVVVLQGDVSRIVSVAVWSVIIYILYGYFKQRKPWARTALAMLTLPFGLLLFSQRFKTYLAQRPNDDAEAG